MRNEWASHLEALADANQPQAAFENLEAIVQKTVGARLFTAIVHDFREGKARRIYSNRNDVYPAGGWKPIVKTRYFTTVIEEKRPFVSRSIDEIQEVFFDHEIIRSLGCESSCHIPVVVSDFVLGVFNMLNVSGYYDDDKARQALDLRPFAVGPFFLARKQESAWW